MKFKDFIKENVKIGDHIVKKIKTNVVKGIKHSIYDIDEVHPKRSNMFVVIEDKDGWIMNHSFVPKEYQRQGIATTFYIEMNKQSKSSTKKPLRSTLVNPETDLTDLTNQGMKLWESLVKKGLAKKLGDRLYSFK